MPRFSTLPTPEMKMFTEAIDEARRLPKPELGYDLAAGRRFTNTQIAAAINAAEPHLPHPYTFARVSQDLARPDLGYVVKARIAMAVLELCGRTETADRFEESMIKLEVFVRENLAEWNARSTAHLLKKYKGAEPWEIIMITSLPADLQDVLQPGESISSLYVVKRAKSKKVVRRAFPEAVGRKVFDAQVAGLNKAYGVKQYDSLEALTAAVYPLVLRRAADRADDGGGVQGRRRSRRSRGD